MAAGDQFGEGDKREKETVAARGDGKNFERGEEEKQVNGGIDEFPREEQVIGFEDGGVGEAGEADGAVRNLQTNELQ